MLASVVVVNHDYGRFVGDAIDSALGQTHQPLEVVVVDDGSTDDSREVIAAYEDRVVAVLQENRGQSGAYNAGFAASRGELVVFLDSDDVLLPTAVERAAAALASDPDAAYAHWKMLEVDAALEPTGELNPVEPLVDGDVLGQLLDDGPLQWSSPGAAWRRSALEQALPVPEGQFRQAADAYLTAVMPFHGTVRALDEPQSLYRRHGGGHSEKAFDARLLFDVEVTLVLCGIVAELARERGLACDQTRWLDRGWSFRLMRALHEIDGLVDARTPFVLVDDQELALDSTSGRAVLPFLERDGEYWGQPEDDDHAIRELERMRSDGAALVVIAWPSFWWLDSYPRFAAHVRERYLCVLENERLVAFDLRAPAAQSSA